MNDSLSLVDVLPLTPASDVKHVVRKVIPQPRPAEGNAIAFNTTEEGTVVEHTVHAPILLPSGKYTSSIQQEVNPLTGILENTND